MSSPEQPQSPTSLPNPILEVKADSLAELFARDPNDWNSQDLNVIVAALRADRKRHQEAELAGKVKGASKKAPAPASLDELGLS